MHFYPINSTLYVLNGNMERIAMSSPRALVLVIAFMGWLPGYAQGESVQIQTDSGALLGTISDGVKSFKGVPYAAAPVGDLRWRAPRPPMHWSQPLNANDFGASCPQSPPPRVPPGSGAERTSEDCLTLNLWGPVTATKSAPVMVWIHGGGNTQGSGAGIYYDGTAFAHDGVLLVTINYRLGLLGFFAHPALTREAAGGPTANFGLLDQLAALSWVHRNIAAFGGDPTNVTVFGESAGATDIVALLASPASKGLFQKAIVESAALGSEWPTVVEASGGGAQTASALGLPGEKATVAQLRALPVQRLMQEADRISSPVIDGILLRQQPLDVFAQGHGLDVPLIIGTNGNEGSLLGPNPNLAHFTALDLPAVRALYGAPAGAEADLARALFRDTRFAAPARWIAGHRVGTSATYLYRFDYVLSLLRRRRSGADHGSEIPYVFSTWTTDLLSETDRKMTAAMHSCWIAFTRGSVPNCEQAPAWPVYRPESDLLMHFSDQAAVEKTDDAAALDVLAEHASKVGVADDTGDRQR
jgi:para-nitrobenzyl esterase